MNKTLYPLGSEWRKWDLHFHTPASFDYKNKSITNDQIISTLKDNSISVVAITDHHIMDTERITALITLGEKQGITVFPGIELRSELGGSESVHFIGIFSNKSNISEVWAKIQAGCSLFPSDIAKKGNEKVICDFKDTCRLIKQLGGIVTVHAGGKSNSIESIKNNHEYKQFLKADILKDYVDVLELGNKQDQDDYNDIIFPNINIRLPMILGSDNHQVLEYQLKDFCWIKADPTFNGLKQIIYEPESRVFIGNEPPSIIRVKNNKTKYIKELKINCNKNYDGKNGEWFKDVVIKFNSELVAIIGNKGSGKSALSDICGVLGHSHNVGINHENLSFLNGKLLKFRKRGFAENFDAQLIWEDGTGNSASICLNHDVDFTEKEKIKYLPQSYFELITNDLDANGFEKTLKDVIFLHIPVEETLGCTTFDDLEATKIQGIETDINSVREQILTICEKIKRLETKSTPEYKAQINSLLANKQKELDEHIKNKPADIFNPNTDTSPEKTTEKKEMDDKLSQLNAKNSELMANIEENREKLKVLLLDKESLGQIQQDLQRLATTVSHFITQNKEKFCKYGLDIDDLITFALKDEEVMKLITLNSESIDKVNEKLLTPKAIVENISISTEQKEDLKVNSLYVQQFQVQEQIDIIKRDLSKSERDFQEYKEKLIKWESKKKQIEGATTIAETLIFYINEENYLKNTLQSELDSVYEDLISKSLEIYRKKKEIISLYEMFKVSVDTQMMQDAEFVKKFKMEINAGFKITSDFSNKFLNYINKTKSGTYRGAEEKQVSTYYSEKNLLEEIQIETFLRDIIRSLKEDQRNEVKGTETKRYPINQIENINQFFDYIFSLSYLKPIYELTLDGKTLIELSPGERGALLLVFYLMIDKEDKPLIIDQPEDNLDNKSVYEVLTHFIKIAKKRRQIIIVTHNPNLAVGADAEQIIYVNLDKKNNYKFEYEMGSIEDKLINERVVEILEGTRPAFDQRKLRYTN